mmetsp:Transcript_5136/g.9015  ORF Transcript_5136/g.9015 Transcript_5136/m.9015 type:complete len:205 (-) Transcript_5136:472-1086(-)
MILIQFLAGLPFLTCIWNLMTVRRYQQHWCIVHVGNEDFDPCHNLRPLQFLHYHHRRPPHHHHRLRRRNNTIPHLHHRHIGRMLCLYHRQDSFWKTFVGQMRMAMMLWSRLPRFVDFVVDHFQHSHHLPSVPFPVLPRQAFSVSIFDACPLQIRPPIFFVLSLVPPPPLVVPLVAGPRHPRMDQFPIQEAKTCCSELVYPAFVP